MVLTPVDEMTEAGTQPVPGSPSGTSKYPQCPFLIDCSSAVLEQIRREVERGRDLPQGGRETGGVLFGISEPGRIRILASKPLPCEHSLGPGFVLSGKDEDHLAQLISAAATDSDLAGWQALGWYHSHLHSRISLSERDRQIHSRYFAAPYQVALVIRPKPGGTARAGFFFREASGELRTASSYEEFTIEPPRPAARELKQAVGSKQAPSQARRPSSPKPVQPPAETICPKCGSRQLRRSRRTGPAERFLAVFGFYPYRCHECLSRSFLKTSSDLLERARSSPRRRPEERKRARLRTRREIVHRLAGHVPFVVWGIRHGLEE